MSFRYYEKAFNCNCPEFSQKSGSLVPEGLLLSIRELTYDGYVEIQEDNGFGSNII